MREYTPCQKVVMVLAADARAGVRHKRLYVRLPFFRELWAEVTHWGSPPPTASVQIYGPYGPVEIVQSEAP